MYYPHTHPPLLTSTILCAGVPVESNYCNRHQFHHNNNWRKNHLNFPQRTVTARDRYTVYNARILTYVFFFIFYCVHKHNFSCFRVQWPRRTYRIFIYICIYMYILYIARACSTPVRRWVGGWCTRIEIKVASDDDGSTERIVKKKKY